MHVEIDFLSIPFDHRFDNIAIILHKPWTHLSFNCEINIWKQTLACWRQRNKNEF